MIDKIRWEWYNEYDMDVTEGEVFDVKKWKSTGFALLYFAITFLVQFIIGIGLVVQLLLFKMRGIEITEEVISQFQDNYAYNLILVALVNLVLIAGMGLWYFFIRRRECYPKPDYRKILSAKSVALLVALALCAQFACNLVMGVFYMFFPGIYEDYAELMKGVDINVLPAWAMVLIVAVWAPLAEEIVFRCMIFRTLRKGFSMVPAAILSGIAFGIYHMNWVQGVYASLLGFLLAVIYEKSGSLLGNYLFHLFFNLSSYGLEFVEKYAGLPESVINLGTLGLMIIAIPGILFFMKKYAKLFGGQNNENI